jgi:hypothetical protein
MAKRVEAALGGSHVAITFQDPAEMTMDAVLRRLLAVMASRGSSSHPGAAKSHYISVVIPHAKI